MEKLTTSRRNFLMGASAAASILALAGCGGNGVEQGSSETGGESGSEHPNILNVGQTSVAIGPNIWYQNDLNSATIMYLVCPPPIEFDENGTKFGFLTEDPIVNDDATEWTITLKEGLCWNDGTPLTAEDVVFGAKYGTDNHIGFYDSYYSVVDFDKTEIIDEHTVKFVLSSANVNFWNGAGYWEPFMRKSIWENVADPSTFSLEYPGDGYGPYYIKEWKDGEYVDLVKNEHYTQNNGAGANIDEIIFRFYTDENAAVLALQNGEIDVIANYITDQSASQLATDPKYQIESIDALGYALISFSQGIPALQDKEVRQAFAKCIDRDAICNVAWAGAATPMYTPISPVYADLVQSNITQPAFSVEDAAAQLEAAGYIDSGDGVRANGDKRLEFTLTYRSTLPNVDGVMSIIVDDLRKAGIKINKEPVDAATFSEKVTQGHKYELSYSSWGVIDDVDTTLLTCFGIGQTLNFMEFNDQTQEDLLRAMQAEVDYDKRKGLLDQWQTWFVENLPCVHLFVPSSTYVASTEHFDGWKLVYGNSGYFYCKPFQNVKLK
ncbi:ABC transporter substrate-binding protein [Coriobacteriales bacterium OH1046]|nr:ABC transporter substrate-binding protein [Coriobacteriales bacterium OH1046]